jgi:hypothetical protein
VLEHAQRGAEISEAIDNIASDHLSKVSGNLRLAAPPSISDSLTSLMQLTLQIGLGDLQIPKGHADVFVTHQLLESGQADSASEHFRGPGVTQTVRR